VAETVPDAVTQREIAETLRTFARSHWRSMTLEINGLRVVVGKDGPPAGMSTAPADRAGTQAPAPAPATPPVTAAATPAPLRSAAPPVDTTGLVDVRSPAVGAFWVAPSPGAPPFVEVGQVVDADEQLAIVEVMKLMNPVVAPHAGEIVHVCANNADLVEYDQVLFWIRPGHV
jgi:acetyl-CoA carboxylase biotin carboxyl carrier protein